MSKREYLLRLTRQSPDWLRASMAEPTHYMTRTHVLLHAVALRRMRALTPNVERNRDARHHRAAPVDGSVRPQAEEEA